MKNITTFIAVSLIVMAANSQVISDSISMQQFYTQQVFYSLDNGEISSVDNTNWDIAFSLYGNGAAGSAILLNESNTSLWAYPGDTSEYTNFDTTGYENWERLLNSDTTWINGAFNKYRGESGVFDLGWGILNPTNNYWTFGDSLYLIKLSDDSFRKLWIVSLKSGIWEYKYANLDGSNEQIITFDKSTYSNRNFVYQSILTNQLIDREPDNTAWDITFTKHIDFLNPPGIYQSVTSVFNNRNVWTAKANEVDFAAASVSISPQTNFNQKIDNIGREWKKYNSSTGWGVYDSIAYFLYDNDSTHFYRMVFTAFGGMGNGKAFFDKELLETVSVNELNISLNWSIYPNPANEQITLLLDYPLNGDVQVDIIDLSGKMVSSQSMNVYVGINQKTISTGHLQSGIYVVVLRGEEFQTTQKLVIQ